MSAARLLATNGAVNRADPPNEDEPDDSRESESVSLLRGAQKTRRAMNDNDNDNDDDDDSLSAGLFALEAQNNRTREKREKRESSGSGWLTVATGQANCCSAFVTQFNIVFFKSLLTLARRTGSTVAYLLSPVFVCLALLFLQWLSNQLFDVHTPTGGPLQPIGVLPRVNQFHRFVARCQGDDASVASLPLCLLVACPPVSPTPGAARSLRSLSDRLRFPRFQRFFAISSTHSFSFALDSATNTATSSACR
jgi:hypothetical protein